MALEAPLRSSTGDLPFAFNQTDSMSGHSESEDQISSPFRPFSSPPPVTDSGLLRPNSVQRISSHSMHIMSPSDIVGPSPVTSNGTETTEIEDDASDDIEQPSLNERVIPGRRSELLTLSTEIPDHLRQSSEEAVSVIHAPESFAAWKSGEPFKEQNSRRTSLSPKTNDPNIATLTSSPPENSLDHPTRPLVSTDVNPVRYSIDSATPRAQNLQDMLNESSRLRSSSTSSLEKIDEQTEASGDEDDDYISQRTTYSAPRIPPEDGIAALKTALHECWTLCNTLASLSSIHRARVFSTSTTPDSHERAWKTCWKLCQQLYENQGYEGDVQRVRMNLDLCRDFCQALFEVRQKKDELADSVLRVSFELNNHLFSAQDNRVLPEPFQERTLDFYITLCHRLMKQNSDLAEETDQLLRACWTLAEMLFSLRRNARDGRDSDEELLSSAVQACWELSDIFRSGWTQVRPERNTPRSSQTSFFGSQISVDPSGRESRTSNRSSYSKRESVKSSKPEERARKQPPVVPETPVTEFEDTPISPESRSPQMPNIMVLGTTSSENGRSGRWSSNASNLSSYSQSSNRTSSTATTTAATEDPNVSRAKVLVLRAAMNMGFDRDTITDPKVGATTLQRFVQNLPSGSFGSSPQLLTLLQQYKNSVLTDAFIPRKQVLPIRGRRVFAQDMSMSVLALCKNSPRYGYLRELFRFVFQFPLEEADTRRNVSIVV